ncbi:T9SS type A sorting domain-containing protein [Gilvibacter sp.]|uniref:T9SS type A sorting domain-containing protein n=1 Tax=Gilvibacter sp. TaxID=2729997 RepID=UPI0035BE484A
MKNYVFTLLVFISGSYAFSQDYDPDLVNTWYLVSTQGDLGDPYFTVDVEPPISPYISINEDLSFEGFGACNSFTGQFSVEPDLPSGYLYLTAFDATDDDCGFESHNLYEGFYFGILNVPGEKLLYFVDILPDSSIFWFQSWPGFELTFQLETLSVVENEKPTISIYPNPTSDYFVINKSIPADAEITLFSMSGQIQKLDYKTNGVYDVSFLSSGVYFLTITTSEWRKQVKLVKN